MQDLKVIENELVPVYKTSTGEKVVDGRELYEVLQSKQDFSIWVKKRLNECDAIENKDFCCFHRKIEANNDTMIEYHIKLDTAKEMAMLERNEKGKQVRRYFIQVEKKYKEQAQKPLSAIDQIRLQNWAIVEVDEKLETVNRDLQDFKTDLPLLGIEIDYITNAVHKRGVEALGGKDSNAYNDRSLRGKIYRDIYQELKRQFGVTTYKAIKRNQCKLAVAIIDTYELPYVLTEQIRDCNAQMNMEVD